MASGTMNLTFSNNPYMAGRLEWTATAGTSSQNYSTVTVKVYAWRTNTGYTTYRTPRIDFTINGTTYSVDATSSSTFTYNSNTLCATKTVTVNHNSDGTKTCAIGLASTSSLWDASSTTYYFNAVSQNVTFDKIARYTSFTYSAVEGTSLDLASISWETADTCDYVRYYFNGSSSHTNVGAVSAKYGSFNKTGLLPNTSYTIIIEVRRADSQLWTKSASLSFKTKAKTTLASISDTTPTIGRNLTYTLSNPSGTGSVIRVYVKDSGGSWGTHPYEYYNAPNSGTLSLSDVKAAMYDRAINMASTQYLVRVYSAGYVYYNDYTYNVNMPASTVSITNANIGSAATISVSRDDANLTHNITYVFGSGSGTVATGVTTSNSWTTPTSLASKISNAKSGTCTITCTTKHGTATVGSKTATCTLTIPTSSISLSASSADMGVSRTLTIGRIYTNLTHIITYSFNGATGTIATAATTSSSWTFPVATLAPKIPNATSGTGTITCTTKNGTATVGTSSVSFTATVPTSVVPTFTSFIASELNTAVTTALGVIAARTDNYVRSLSNMRLAISGAAGAYGSTISTYRITFDGVNQDSTTTKTKDINVNWSGNKVVSCRITDSRGRTASSSNITISALDYNPIGVSTFTVSRCDIDGTLNEMGTYARVNIVSSVSSLIVNSIEKNTINVNLYSKTRSSTSYTLVKTLSGSTSINSDTYNLSGYLETTSYDFQLVINDVFDSVTKIHTLSSSSVVMSWGETGVGIGKIWEQGALDIAGDVFVNGNPLGGNTLDSLPVGMSMPWYSDALPSSKWLVGEGQSLDSYPEAQIVWGSNLPDTRGKTLVGQTATGTFSTLGATVGSETTTAVPSHSHSINHDHPAVTSGSGGVAHTHAITHDHGAVTSAAGGVAHTHAITHDHGAVTSGTQSANHTHSIAGTATSNGAHTHGVRYKFISGVTVTDTTGYVFLRRTETGDSYSGTDSDAANSAGAHTHTLSGTSGGNSVNHTHSVDLPSFSGTSGGASATSHTHSVDLPSFSGTSGAASATSHTHAVDVGAYSGSSGSTGTSSVSLVQPSMVVRWIFKVVP